MGKDERKRYTMYSKGKKVKEVLLLKNQAYELNKQTGNTGILFKIIKTKK